MTKLTLNVDPDVIEEARKLAEQSGTSVSSMFERMIRLLAIQRCDTRPLGPLTRRASGMIVLTSEASEQQILEEALVKKHGLSR
jgi:hypothetical protein